MLKEQLLVFATKAISQVYETKERIKNNLNVDLVQNYVRNIKDVASKVVEAKLKKTSPKKRVMKPKNKVEVSVKNRKSSIKPVKEISSKSADKILEKLKIDQVRMPSDKDEVDGKKSLAYLLWALGHAERANIKDGITIHDVSALLYRSNQIELYPINISRVVYGTPLVRQVSMDSRTKTYLLSPEGKILFEKKYL